MQQFENIVRDSDLQFNTQGVSIGIKPWYLCKKDEDNLLHYLRLRKDQLMADSEYFHERSKNYNSFYEEVWDDIYASLVAHGQLAKSWNLLRVAVDAHFNRIAKFKPRITFLPKNAKSGIAQKASDLDDWMLNLFMRSGLYPQSRDAYKDCLVSNLGTLKIIPNREKKNFTFKRVIPRCISFEKPYQGSTERDEAVEMGVYKLYDIIAMVEMSSLPDKEKNKVIDNLKAKHTIQDEEDEGGIKVFELVRARRKKAIFTDKVVINFHDWKYDWIPYVFHRWDKKQTGIVGTGPAELVIPAQRKINGLLYRVDQNIEYFANQYVIIPKNSDLEQIDNDFGKFYEMNMMGLERGQRPIHITPAIMNPQVFEFIDKSYQMGLECARVSQLQSEGRMPTGTNHPSGKFLRYYYDVDNSRFVASIYLYEESFKEVAKKVLEWGCDLYPKEAPFKGLDMKMKEELLNSTNKFAENLLPESPVGRMDVLQNLVSMGTIKQEAFLELLDAPDVSGFITSESSRLKAIKKRLEDRFMLGKDKGKALQPDPVLGYAEQREIALKIYSQIVNESDMGWEDPKLVNLRTFIKQIKQAEDKIKMDQINAIAKKTPIGTQTPLPKPPKANPNNPGGGAPAT